MSDDPQVGKGKKDRKKDRKNEETNSVDPWAGGQFIFELRSPVKAYDENVSKFVLRKPTSEDTIIVGSPVTVNMLTDPVEVKFNDRKMAEMLSRLANVPVSAVGQMDTKDFAAASWIIAPFFLPT